MTIIQSDRSTSSQGARVLIFADDVERHPRLYVCAKCGSLHSPEIYLATRERAHEVAREAAENCYNCKTHDTCKDCGCETPKGWLSCDACLRSNALERAVEVPDNGGPYCAFNGDEYFHDMEEAQFAGLEWVSPCDITYPNIDIDGVLDQIISDMHEDASIDDLNGVDALEAAIKAFNDAQTTQSWFGDCKRKIRVPALPDTKGGE